MPNTFTNNPQPTHTLANDQPNITANFLYLINTLGSNLSRDHQLAIGDADNASGEGRHRQIGFLNRNGAAPTVAGLGDSVNALLYSDSGNLFFGSANGAGNLQLTRYNSGSNFGQNNAYGTPPAGFTQTGGWTFLPGNLLLQYGLFGKSNNLGSSGTIQFPIAFTGNPFCITAILIRSSSNSQSMSLPAAASSTTSFQFQSTSSGSDFVYWTAIGV